MILAGWKEIAAHLRCGIRTLQRWEARGLPVTRPAQAAGESRGLVMADSEALDSWVHKRAAHRMRSDVALNIERAKSLQVKLREQVRVMLQTELAVGMTHIRIARGTGNHSKASRHLGIARRAYETIIQLSQRIPSRDSHSRQFTADLGKLKAALRERGEKV